MSFYTYHSNHLDLLQEITGHIIKNDPLESIFDKEYFLVQNFGMAKWMQVGLAGHLGILTQAEFLLPAKMLNNLFDRIFQDNHALNIARLNQDQLFWPLIILLSNLPDEAHYRPLHRYMESDDPDEVLRRTMMLAKEIAALFDQYIVHRADWIAAWDRGELIDELPDHQLWQKALWNQLTDFYQHPTHFGNIRPHVERALDDPNVVAKLPKRIFIMGLTSLPPLFLDLLLLFSPYMDIHLFFNNPSRFYWGDVTKFSLLQAMTRYHESTKEPNHDLFSPHMPDEPDENWQDYYGHPILASFGKVGRDHLRLLAQYEPYEIEAFSEPEPRSLLKHLHYTLYNLIPPTEKEHYSIAPDDHSIVIHQVYSRMREIEVLYDQLLHHFNHDPTLKPRDIVIMTPDIEAYAPIIHAVFGNAHADRYIPYSISDVSLATEEPTLEVFLTLLSLPESEFRASDIMEMLQIPDLYQHFNIEDSQLELIQFWIQDVGIHFGIDDDHLHSFELKSDGKNHWLWGLKRLLLGYISGEQNRLYDHHLPYPHIEGLDALILGNLIHFVEMLVTWRSKLMEPRPLSEWQTIITPLWNDFFLPSDENQLKLSYLLKEWNQIIEGGMDAGFEEAIPLNELRLLLQERIDNERPEQNFIEGKVTFCSFIPMRAIPFTFVGMIGLTQEAFPTTNHYADFNLMQYLPYPGDRTRHHDDRYLFLEAILSAQETLYLSYIGRSIQDNSEKLPSLLIDELLNYLQSTTDTAQLDENTSLRKHLTFLHPMASYNPKLFEAGSPIQSFQKEWIQQPNQNDDYPHRFELFEVERITPQELLRLYQRPIETFCNRRLDLQDIRRNNDLIDDDEPFIIDGGLSQYQLRSAILKEMIKSNLSGDALKTYCQDKLLPYFDHQGILPKYHYRDITWQRLTAPLLEMADMISSHHYSLNEQETIKIESDTITIEGKIPACHEAHYLLWSVGNLNRHRRLEAYLYHLMQSYHHNDIFRSLHTTYLYIDKHSLKQHTIEPMEIAIVEDQLLHFLEYYQKGLTTPMISSMADLTRPESALLNEWIPQEPDLTFEALYQMDEATASGWIMERDSEIQQLVKKLMQSIPHGALERRLFPNIGYREGAISALFHHRFLQNI